MRILMIGSPGVEAGLLQAHGAVVEHVEDVAAARRVALGGGVAPDLVLCPLSHDIGGLLGALERAGASIPVVACGPCEHLGGVARALELGAHDYLPMPAEPELVAELLESVLPRVAPVPVVAHDPAMTSMLRRAELVAPSGATVLITGESGSGKEVVAALLHRVSGRQDGPFVAVNCAAIPEAMLEMELFGHERGAFPGAERRRIGKFEAADGGTLLLDEVGELDLRMQAKLLRAVQDGLIQNRAIDRLGGRHPVQVDVRIVATTNRDLAEEVRAGRFRADLFFRLNVITLKVPPLRQRPGDIGPLAEHFARRFALACGRAVLGVSGAAVAELRRHAWPGNVRELENVIQRAVLVEDGREITAASLDIDASEPAALGQAVVHEGPPRGRVHTSGRTIEAVEKDMILGTLCDCQGNRAKTAAVLGISIRTLRNKLHEYERDGTRIPRPVVVAVA